MLLSQLATVFAPYISGSKAPVTGISVNGVDLSDLFAPLSAGTAIAANTGFTAAGLDLKQVFAAIGSTQPVLFDWVNSACVDVVYDNPSATATAFFRLNPDGTYEGSGGISGRWLSSALVGSDYEVQALLASGDALTTNDMVSFTAISVTRTVELSTTTSGYSEKQCSVGINIRNITSPSPVYAGNVTLVASATAGVPL